MPTKRNDNPKDFAIGTKIEYNGKLYEVTEQKYCENCSIVSICTNTDISSGNRIGDVISREQRLNIFGECSSVARSDGKSVIFKEVQEDTSDENFYKITPLFTDSNHIQLRPIEIALPNGCEIDVKSSDLNKGIVRFKRKWLTLEQIYKLANDNDYITSRSAIKDFSDDKLAAIANLIDIARYFNGDWKYNVTKENVGYAIAYYKFVAEPHYSVCKIDNSVYTYYGNPVFKNEADAQYVIDNPNFKDILDKIFKV